MAIMGIPAIVLVFAIPYTASLAVLVIFKYLVPILYGSFVIYAFSFPIFNKLKLLQTINENSDSAITQRGDIVANEDS